MTLRLRMAAWFTVSVGLLLGALIFVTHLHLDEELRDDRWDRSHPKFASWVIHGSYTDAEVHDILGELMHVWLWVGGPILIASAAAGYWLAGRSVRPIRRINAELDALAPGEMGRGVSVPESDPELAGLVSHINQLLSRAHDSYAEMAEFSARVAHEIRNPLTLLRMRVEAAAPRLEPAFSEGIQESLHDLSQLVERSLLAAKAEKGRAEPALEGCQMDAILEDMRDAYSVLAMERGFSFEWSAESGFGCTTDPGWLRQILHNLLGNAVRHGASKIRFRARQSSSGRRLSLTILNDKSSAVTKAGTGIGLRLVRALVNQLPGTRFRSFSGEHFHAVSLILPSSATHTLP